MEADFSTKVPEAEVKKKSLDVLKLKLTKDAHFKAGWSKGVEEGWLSLWGWTRKTPVIPLFCFPLFSGWIVFFFSHMSSMATCFNLHPLDFARNSAESRNRLFCKKLEHMRRDSATRQTNDQSVEAEYHCVPSSWNQPLSVSWYRHHGPWPRCALFVLSWHHILS